MAIIRMSYISTGLTKISQSILVEIANKKATHVTFHANQICSLEIKSTLAPEIGSNVELNYLVDLDLSSNSLHSGYVLTNFRVDKRSISLLGCCRSLLKLNLSANEFTSKSYEAFVSSMTTLPHLTTLDISHNNISKLPSDLKQKCPSLRSLSALSNQIKSLSALLNWLHQFRGQLDSLSLSNQKGSINPVCSATLYREKVIFVLGDGFLQLDSRNISENERRKVCVRLSMYSPSSGCSGDEDVNRLSLVQERKKTQEQHQPAQTPHFRPRSNDTNINDENNAKSSDIEFLSNLIERQAHITSGLLDVTQNRNDDQIEICDVDGDEHDDIVYNKALEVQVENAAAISDLRRTAACTLVKLALVKKKQKQTLLRMTFSQWVAATRFSRHLQSLKSKFTKSEVKWRDRANDVVTKAIKKEQEKGTTALKEAEEKNKVAEEKVVHLNERVKELEVNIKFEQSKSATFAHNSTTETDRLSADLQQARANMKRMDEEQTKKSRLVAVEIESIRGELHHTQQELQKEKEDNDRLEMIHKKDFTKATQEARRTATEHSAEAHDLKLELLTKDATITQLKAAYEQAATRAASDRSKCEHVLAGERQKTETMKSYTKKLRSLESDKQKLVALRADLEAAAAKKESRISSMQQAVHDNATKVSNLKAAIEEKDCKIDSFERRLKFVSDERDDFHHQLTESKRVRAQLQSQLDLANDEVRDVKWCSSEAHQLETMKRQQNLDALRQSSQLREQELSANMKLLRRECQEKVAKQAQLIKSLDNKLKGCGARETELERSHRAELRELRNCREQELRPLQETLADESESRVLLFYISKLHVILLLILTQISRTQERCGWM